jgi:hypothetical protein
MSRQPRDTRLRLIEDATPFHAAVDWKMGALALGAAAAVAIAFRASLTLDISAADFNPIVAVPVLMAGYGILQLVQAYRAWRVGRRFGDSVFEMRGAFVRRDGMLRGRILTARDLSPQGGFTLRLRSIERRQLGEHAGDLTRRAEDRILWEASSLVHAARSQSDGIAVSFDIPEDATAGSRGGAIRWTLEAVATVEGARYEALFGVPMAAGRDDEDPDGG